MKKRFLYSKFVKFFALLICLPFYRKKYLKGYFFDQKRAGFIWAIKGIPMRIRSKVPWPISKHTFITNHKNISFDQDSINVFQSPGCYFQAIDAKIKIGKNVHIGPNVGIITTNHNPSNLREHLEGEDVLIGDNTWIGMNSVILPGVVLGPNTIVGAGSVVNKSFPDGGCLIAGVPARFIKNL